MHWKLDNGLNLFSFSRSVFPKMQDGFARMKIPSRFNIEYLQIIEVFRMNISLINQKKICVDERKNVSGGSGKIFHLPFSSQNVDKWKMSSAEFSIFSSPFHHFPLWLVFLVVVFRALISMMEIYWSYSICIFLSCRICHFSAEIIYQKILDFKRCWRLHEDIFGEKFY